MSSLTHLAKLRGLMLDMESEVGLTDVSHLERGIKGRGADCENKRYSRTSVFRILISSVYIPRVEVSY